MGRGGKAWRGTLLKAASWSSSVHSSTFTATSCTPPLSALYTLPYDPAPVPDAPSRGRSAAAPQRRAHTALLRHVSVAVTRPSGSSRHAASGGFT